MILVFLWEGLLQEQEGSDCGEGVTTAAENPLARAWISSEAGQIRPPRASAPTPQPSSDVTYTV